MSRYKCLSSIVLVLFGILIFVLVWPISNAGLIKTFWEDNGNEQDQPIKKLNERLISGRLSKDNIDKIMHIINEHLENRTRTIKENSNTQPRIGAYELDFGWNAIEKGIADNKRKMDFLYGIMPPWCQYQDAPKAEARSFELHGEGGFIPAGWVSQYQLMVTSMDGRVKKQQVMNQFITFKTRTGITFSRSEPVKEDLNPSQSLSVLLITTWYSLPVELIADLPEDPQKDIEKMNNILKMNSVKKICEYSKTAELLKSKNWKNFF